MEELHICTLTRDDNETICETIESMFEAWKTTHPRAHVKQLHYSTCYKHRDLRVVECVLIEYTEES